MGKQKTTSSDDESHYLKQELEAYNLLSVFFQEFQ